MNRIFSTTLILVMCTLSGMSQTGNTNWDMYRGSSDLSGRTDTPIPSDPKLLWSLKTNCRSVSSPVINNGTIYFGNNDGTLYAVSSTGKIVWKFEAGTSIEAAPVIIDNKVIFGSLDGDLRALSASTGELLWQYETENQIVGSVNIWKDNNESLIIVGSYDYCLHCINPKTGKQVWKLETNDFIHGTPAIIRNKIVFGGCDGLLRIVEPFSGREERFADLGVYIASSPALSGGQAFVGSYEGKFYAINLQTMTIDWETSARDEYSVIKATPAINRCRVVVGSEDKYLYCYTIADGEKMWEFRTGGRITGSAVISGDNVLFGSRDGIIYLLSLESGVKRWSFDTGKPITSSPAVTDKMFCILTEDGRLLAFGN